MYIFMATFIGLIMNSKCQQTLLTIKIFRIENVMYFTFLFIAVVRYGSQFQNTLIDYICYFNTYIL